MYVCAPFESLVPKEIRDGIRSSGPGVTDDYELPCECKNESKAPGDLWEVRQVQLQLGSMNEEPPLPQQTRGRACNP